MVWGDNILTLNKLCFSVTSRLINLEYSSLYLMKTFLLLCASFLINQTVLPQQNQFDIALDNAEKNYLINNDSFYIMPKSYQYWNS